VKEINIAIDGFSSCGKSTLAKSLAKELNFVYIDTGAMYRAVTLYAIRQGIIANGNLNEKKLVESLDSIQIDFISRDGKNLVRLNNEIVESEIRKMYVSESVSYVSVIPEVRRKMQEAQRKLGLRGGVVMDGRDIGTSVLPNAELKIFMTASPEIRAQRRYEELLSKGEETSLEEVQNNLQKRDKIDSEREEDPLTQAPDARILDNTVLSEKEQLDKALNWVRELNR
jgi:cytidylate kinase